MEIKLLAAPVVLPPTTGGGAESTSLVPASRFPSANQVIPRSDTAYPNDSYVWSVTAGDNGSFHFYAVPLKNFLNGGNSSQQDGFLPTSAFSPDWTALNMRNAATQYQLQASAPMLMRGHLLNVYA